MSNVHTDAAPGVAHRLRFRDIPEPRMVAFFTGNGSGSKLYQGFLDGHPELFMIPGYLLMYFYPHWYQWMENLGADRSWRRIVDAFCVNHASALDTRRIPGFDGLASLGPDQSEHIEISEPRFRETILCLLEEEPIAPRTFLLAVHYAYALCRNEDIGRKKALFYHIHVHKYVVDYLAPDFPDMQIIAMVRDPRSNFRGRFWSSAVAVDEARLNATDAAIYLPRTYNYVIWEQLNGLDILSSLGPCEVRVVRHEDLYYRPADVMKATAHFIGISDDSCFQTVSFGGKLWWGETIYGAQPMNAANPSIVSDKWKSEISARDWYVFEGLFFDYMRKYGYPLFKYRRDGIIARIRLLLCLLPPSGVEMRIWFNMFRPTRFRSFLRASIDESRGCSPLKDYGSNAYYRHKWTNRELRLWKPRFFRVQLAIALHGIEDSDLPLRRAAFAAASSYYVLFSVLRYAGASLGFPIHWGRRTGIFLSAWWRRCQGRNVLPDPLS